MRNPVKFVGFFSLCAFAISASLAFAATDEKAAAKANATETTVKETETSPKKKSTEMSFDDVLVQGKYHFSDEAVTTVEQDKILDGLLTVRRDFKDRLKKSASLH